MASKQTSQKFDFKNVLTSAMENEETSALITAALSTLLGDNKSSVSNVFDGLTNICTQSNTPQKNDPDNKYNKISELMELVQKNLKNCPSDYNDLIVGNSKEKKNNTPMVKNTKTSNSYTKNVLNQVNEELKCNQGANYDPNSYVRSEKKPKTTLPPCSTSKKESGKGNFTFCNNPYNYPKRDYDETERYGGLCGLDFTGKCVYNESTPSFPSKKNMPKYPSGNSHTISDADNLKASAQPKPLCPIFNFDNEANKKTQSSYRLLCDDVDSHDVFERAKKIRKISSLSPQFKKFVVKYANDMQQMDKNDFINMYDACMEYEEIMVDYISELSKKVTESIKRVEPITYDQILTKFKTFRLFMCIFHRHFNETSWNSLSAKEQNTKYKNFESYVSKDNHIDYTYLKSLKQALSNLEAQYDNYESMQYLTDIDFYIDNICDKKIYDEIVKMMV